MAEHYGLKVHSSGMACCPFHDDKHPSMKIDDRYYCFACGAKGDSINYVAELFGLSNYDACIKISDEFGIVLPQAKKQLIQKSKKDIAKERILYKKQNALNNARDRVVDKWDRWLQETSAMLLQYEELLLWQENNFSPRKSRG